MELLSLSGNSETQHPIIVIEMDVGMIQCVRCSVTARFIALDANVEDAEEGEEIVKASPHNYVVRDHGLIEGEKEGCDFFQRVCNRMSPEFSIALSPD